MYIVGIMSGTSLDAVDSVLIDAKNHQIIASNAVSLPDNLKIELSALNQSQNDDLHRSKLAEYKITELYAKAFHQLVQKTQIDPSKILGIGAHGQTIRHCPNINQPYTIQLLNGALLSQLTQTTVVCDFRAKDVASGGQGAPLAPLFHRALIADESPFAVVNIGGISNISLINGNSSIGYDTGPGNCLLDEWTQIHLGKPYDHDGMWARTGQINQQLLDALSKDPFLKKIPPKSTGRDYYNLDWLQSFLPQDKPLAAKDVIRTLTRFTAQCICKDIPPSIQTIYLAGGGQKNKLLCEDISALTQTKIKPTVIDSQLVECWGFAWIAKQTLQKIKQDTRKITGSKEPLILGCIHYY